MLKTFRTKLNAADRKMNELVVGVLVMMGTFRLTLDQEPDYGIYFMVDYEAGNLSYRVTDHHEEFDDQMTFRSFTEAKGFYQEVVAAGTWSEFKRDVKRRAILDKAGLTAVGGEILRKRDKKVLGNIDGPAFVPTPYLMGRPKTYEQQVYQVVEKFQAVR